MHTGSAVVNRVPCASPKPCYEEHEDKQVRKLTVAIDHTQSCDHSQQANNACMTSPKTLQTADKSDPAT